MPPGHAGAREATSGMEVYAILRSVDTAQYLPGPGPVSGILLVMFQEA